MRYVPALFCSLCLFTGVPGALAQDDAGADSGPLETVDTLATCMDACARVYEFCVTDATIPLCIANVPECRDLAPRTTEIMAAFCSACGRAAVGCEDGSTPDPPSTGAVAPASERPRRAPTAAERERSQLDRARGICSRQRGIWDAESAILMPDGTMRLGICRTPEGAELAQMIRDEHDARAEADEHLGDRITAEERARAEAITSLDARERERYFFQEDLINLIQSSQLRNDARLRCLELGTDRVEFDTSMPVLHVERRPGTEGRWVNEGLRHVTFECPGNGRSDVEPVGSSSRTASSTRPRRPDEHPTLGGEGSGLHVRLQLFGHFGFTSIHPTLAQMRGGMNTLPAGLGFDATVFAPISNGWYVEGGAGLSYDWPDFQPFATNARVWYHAGLSAYVAPVLSIGIGYLGSDRFRPNLSSAYSFHGAYLDLTLHFHMRLEGRDLRGSSDVTDPAFVITLRGAAGAAIRPAAATAPDGLLQLMAGLEF